ncbi:class I SAM-dependent methyltransferase [Nocardia takedensis]|uniref:class I SAM-dependent methyltransferase n=1 Tax=Nocardia takedensis TaxID=259390 RepID=UPI000688D1D2|nr:class I SAM-dependent methyltransferase [Nocardia takedensis]
MPTDEPDHTAAAVESNRQLWNEWAAIHAESDWYDLDAVRAGADKLRPYEVAEVGDVTGLRLLHLQCQIGADSVAWARRGARVTGVDFSPVAVQIATELAQSLAVTAEFVCSDVLALPENLTGAWDVVYASRGVLGWISDLDRWVHVASHFLRPGGTLYLTDMHPLARAVDDTADTLSLGRPYWSRPEPTRHVVTGSYAEPNAKVVSGSKYLWTHSTGDLITAVAQAGLYIEFFHEFPWLDRALPSLTKVTPRQYIPPEGIELPLYFSLRARKLKPE